MYNRINKLFLLIKRTVSRVRRRVWLRKTSEYRINDELLRLFDTSYD